ncbi:MAG: sporulation protein YqfD, partial [Clostridia bacterium]|nr:sporulation protein YqfD [Clostridia bacterium]
TLLVSGFYELSNGNTNLVKSQGEVVAEMVENHSVTVPLRQKIKHFTGKRKKRYVLDFFSLKIPLFLGAEEGEFQKFIEKKMLKNGNSYVPVFLHKIHLREIKESNVLLSEERAEEIAKSKIKERLKDSIIIKIEENKTLTEETLTLNCEVTLQKNIAKTEKILFGTTN